MAAMKRRVVQIVESDEQNERDGKPETTERQIYTEGEESERDRQTDS